MSAEYLLLWRWSTAVQITSALMLMVFFLVVYNTAKRKDRFTHWVAAFVANGIGLTAVWSYWLFRPGTVLQVPLTALYFAGKAAFVLMLLYGVRRFIDRPVPSLRASLAGCVALATLLAVVTRNNIALIGMAQCLMVLLALGAAFFLCVRHARFGLGWLATGFALRIALALAEFLLHMRQATSTEPLPEYAATFLASYSAFDTGAEWMIALGCILAYAFHVREELSRNNEELLAAQRELAEAAQRDPLTSLCNRRMLPHLFQNAAPHGGHLLFFDVDCLKTINDREGHFAGDAALQRFGHALRESFPHHAALRYAGDEFIVILTGDADPHTGLAELRERLAKDPEAGSREGQTLGFSVGVAAFPPHAELRLILQEADAAMYREKQTKGGIARAG